MARRKRGYLASEARKAARAMRPDRVFLRFWTGGKYQTFGGLVRGALGASRQQVPMRAVPPGSPVPKTAGAAKRARAVAAKTASASKQTTKQPVIKKTARGKQVAKRKGKGQFDGSVVLPGADLTLYRRAVDGNAIVQPGEPGRRRI
jgi:hypothetical protein